MKIELREGYKVLVTQIFLSFFKGDFLAFIVHVLSFIACECPHYNGLTASLWLIIGYCLTGTIHLPEEGPFDKLQMSLDAR